MITQVEIWWKPSAAEAERKITIQAVYSKRRTMGLEVKADGRIFARFPCGVSEAEVKDFVGEHSQWVLEKWLLAQKREKERKQRPRRDYEENPGLERIYRQRAKERLTERAAYFAGLMKVNYGTIRLSNARTRWGSCSGQGNLNFHWKLILMPPEVLDYVVVHELAHRKEMNHSKRFWAIVGQVLPDYQQRRRWLKEHGAEV